MGAVKLSGKELKHLNISLTWFHDMNYDLQFMLDNIVKYGDVTEMENAFDQVFNYYKERLSDPTAEALLGVFKKYAKQLRETFNF